AFGLLMVIGIVTFALEVSSDPTRAYAAWLHNYWVFLGLGLAGTFFSAIHYLVGATWSVAVRRVADAFSSFVPVAAVLFAVTVGGPILWNGTMPRLGLGEAQDAIHQLYVWSSPAATQGAGARLIAKNGWLTPGFFILRQL